MVRQKLNKGFVLLDLLIVLIGFSLTNMLFLSNLSLSKLESKLSESESKNMIIDHKLKSISQVNHFCVENSLIVSKYPVCFNAKGNVNQAQTIKIKNSTKHLVIHLGAGINEVK